MIRQPSDWDNIVAGEQRQQIPLGAYVCKILQAIIEDTQYGQVLKVSFDVAEGDQRGYYAADYRANTADDKKWAGVRTVFLPSYDGSEKDERNKRSLKGFCTSVEKSNPGFHCFINGVLDERSLKDKLIGVLMRNEEWNFNGKHGWKVRPFIFISADSVRSGNFRLPEDKPLRRDETSSASVGSAYNEPTAQNNGFTPVETDDLPF